MKYLIALAAQFFITGVAAATAAVHPCDLHAAHPSDPDRVVDGLSRGEVVTHVAIPACRDAVAEFPDEPRFHYQLGRAIVYWAGANDADNSEGIAHVEEAAEMGYTQALFVLGLVYAGQGRVCDAEPLTRQAAEQGLKSARLAYVDHVTAGRWADCEVGASAEEMQGYLEAAARQVTGYYENMLLGSLSRQLDTRKDDDG